MSLDHLRARRHVNKTTSYKQSTTRFAPRLRGKSKKLGRDVEVESPEYQLLVRLYVPSNLLITNNKVDLDELMQYLPTIINDGLPQLNYEIHIFLSCIVSKYVLSWYLLKLNTDDTKFISRIYTVLCEVVKRFSSRVLLVVEGPLILNVMNEVGSIVIKHIENCRIVNGHPYFYEEHLSDSRSLPYDHQSYEDVKKRFLAKNHIVFGNDPNIEDSESMSLYLRVLAKNILDATLKDSEFESDLSPIAQTLVCTVLGNIVLMKVVRLISKPEFILNSVFLRLSGALSKKPSSTEPAIASGLLLRLIYLHAGKVWIQMKNLLTFFKRQEFNANMPAMEDYFLVSLIDSIFQIRQRRPVAVSLISSFTCVVIYFIAIKRGLEIFLGNLFLAKLWQSSLLEDATLAGIVKNLRESIFERSQDAKEIPQSSSLDAFQNAKNSLVELNRQNQHLRLSLGRFISWITDANETENDVELSISNFLSVFNNESFDAPKETSGLNTLLALNLVDCLVKYTYPELVDTAV